MLIDSLLATAKVFEDRLGTVKRTEPAQFWYPAGSLSNLWHLDRLLTGPNRDLRRLAGRGPVADLGAADGELAFFLETLGWDVDVIDWAPTNWNGLRGMRRLHALLGSSAGLHEVDLDSSFVLPRPRYGLVLLLDVLLHLRNPFLALERLSRATGRLVLSTRVARMSPDGRTALRGLPLAYLLSADEIAGDPTNYWVFSEEGLRRLVDRTGWDVVDFATVGETAASDPCSPDHDERAFCLLRSRFVPG